KNLLTAALAELYRVGHRLSLETRGMTDTRTSRLFGALRSLGAKARFKDVPDGDLLQHFAVERDETAFAVMVNRHGAMGQQCCSSLLPNRADADDAFQATFLVLARRASGIRNTGSLSSWLYGVAYRTALKARAAAATRRHYEGQARAGQPAD